MKNAGFFFFFLFFVFSCNKKEESSITPMQNVCEGFIAPEAYSNAPVTAGQDVQLSAFSSLDNVSYEWTGPKKFFSDARNPLIKNISFDMGGVYYVRVKNDECASNTMPVNVIVNDPCDLAINTGTFDSAVWNFYSLVRCGNFISGNFSMNASELKGNISVNFQKQTLSDGSYIYEIDSSGFNVFDSTRVQVVLRKSTNTFYAQGGNAYISVDKSKVTVAFCNVRFKSPATGDVFYGEAKIACQ